MRTAIILSAFVCFPAVALSATIIVPDDQPTIQGAIYAAVDGDTVLVKPGTYVENIYFRGKAITVRSEQGPDVTTIDGNQAYFESAITFWNDEGPDSVIRGFTITNGNGSGIFCSDSSPTIADNVLSGNSCIFGGGLYCSGHSSPLIKNNTIRQNSATGFGYGGGIYCDGGSPQITNNIISGNTATWGGGICSLDCTPTISSNIIVNNSASHDGGGIYGHSQFSVLYMMITNNTISGNSAWQGGGVSCYLDYKPILTNTILWNNDAWNSGKEIYIGNTSILAISYSDLEGGPSSIFIEPGGTLSWGPGMIDSTPLFADPSSGDFHLTYFSPCRGSGDNNAVNESYDFEGDPRIGHNIVDMGADEFYAHMYFTGDAIPGGSVALKFIGLPGASPVGFWIAFNALSAPIPGAYGDWWLLPPMAGPVSIGPMPPNGLRVLPGTIPASPPGPYSLYLQAIMGTPLKLTNLCVMQVQ